MFLKFLLKVTASNGNNNPDWEIVIQENGLSGFARHVMDFHSIFLIGSSKLTNINKFCKLLFET